MYLDGVNGVRSIGDGLLEVSDVNIQKLIEPENINEVYDVEQDPFAR